MTKFSLVFTIFYLFNLGNSFSMADEYITMPNRNELNQILRKAYACSKLNTINRCQEVRNLADPLMDNPLLSAVCKDVVWELLESAKVAKSNNLSRRDSIERPARKISTECLKKTKAINSPNQNRKQVET